MAHWRIDSWDGRGGIAFASWRDFSLTDEQVFLREAPTVVISAPFFQPEPMATRAVGRFATRGLFQTGMFATQSELSFISLEAITDLVRRVYLRFGGRDGLEGGGAPTPPAPEGGSPGLAPFPESPLDLLGPDAGGSPIGGGESGSLDLLNLLQFFKSSSMNALESEPIEGVLTSSELLKVGGYFQPPTIGSLRQPEDLLGWAASLLVHEMLCRFPIARPLVDELRWHEAASALGHMIARLGLWDWLFSPRRDKLLSSWAVTMRQLGSSSWQSELATIDTIVEKDARTRMTFWLLFGGALSIDQDWVYQTTPGVPRGFLRTVPFNRTIKLNDPMEALKLIPLPERLVPIISNQNRPDANLYHFLVASTASPQKLLERPIDGMSVLLFAACSMVHDEGDAYTSFGQFGVWGKPLSPLQSQWLSQHLGRGWLWLSRALPRRIFPQFVETIIAEVTSLRYGGDGMGGGIRPQSYQTVSEAASPHTARRVA